ncbi:major facilitator superfamily protein [Calycina marina]|uniref:Major facilitator superfamily protein n=1 Tax=Calycina marina TaxID=1763456 RepID=A0A9P7Z7E6_9HELO|nr:major facilitator superfamily protein [Calycina marina]
MAAVDDNNAGIKSIIPQQPLDNLDNANRDRDPNQRPKCFSSTLQECLFVLTATTSLAMGTLLNGACSVITAPMAITLDMTTAQITWVQASSALTSGAFLLFFAKVADTFGRRPLLIFAMGAFAACALVAGFATNAMYMDVFCGLMGLWAAAAVPPAIGILGAAYERPSKRKNRAFACFSAGNPIGFVFGSILSGAAAQIFNWRASFYLLAIIYGVLFVAAIWTVPETQGQKERLSWDAIKRFDVFGVLLSIAGISFFCAGLTEAGDASDGWSTPYVIVLLVLGLLLIGAFIAWEGYCRFPLMPLRIWRDRNFSLINIVVLLGFMSFTSSNFWLSLYMQDVLKYSPLMVAVHLLPQCIAGVLVNVVAALILHRINNKLLCGIGALAYVAASLLLALSKGNSSYWASILPSLCLAVIGADLQFNVANMYVMSSLPPAQQSLAGGIFNTVTKIWTAVGLGITSSIYQAESIGTLAIQTDAKPYFMAFWFCVASAGAGCFVVPFLTIGTQGNGTGTSVAGLNEDDGDLKNEVEKGPISATEEPAEQQFQDKKLDKGLA